MGNAITEFLKKISTDTTFREFAQTQPDEALSSFSMSADEKSAVKTLLAKTDGELDFGDKAASFWRM